MISYAFINFLPGCAGNFFSRALNLADGVYCWADSKKKHVPLTVADKMELFTYADMHNFKDKNINWISDFESNTIKYSDIIPHWDLPPGSLSLWCTHWIQDARLSGIAAITSPT